MLDQLRIQASDVANRVCTAWRQHRATLSPLASRVEAVFLGLVGFIAATYLIYNTYQSVKSLVGRVTPSTPPPPPARDAGGSTGRDCEKRVDDHLAATGISATPPTRTLMVHVLRRIEAGESSDAVLTTTVEDEWGRALKAMEEKGIGEGRGVLKELKTYFTSDPFLQLAKASPGLALAWNQKIDMLMSVQPCLFPCGSDLNRTLLGVMRGKLQEKEPDEIDLESLDKLRAWVRECVVKNQNLLRQDITWVMQEILGDGARSLSDEAKLAQYLNHFDRHPERATLVEFWALRWMFPNLKLEFNIIHKFTLSGSDDFSFRDPDNKSDNPQAIRLEYIQGVGFQSLTSEGGPAD
jgi:hypothetical protein